MREITSAERAASELAVVRNEVQAAVAPAAFAQALVSSASSASTVPRPVLRAADHASAATTLMRLQRLAGNRATRALLAQSFTTVQRQGPATKTDGGAPSPSPTSVPATTAPPATVPGSPAPPSSTGASAAPNGAGPPAAPGGPTNAPAPPAAPGKAPGAASADGGESQPAKPVPPAESGTPPAAEVALDDDVEKVLNQRKDPAVAAGLEKAVGQGDAFRLSALQYSYTPSDWWKTVKQTVTQSDAFVEHARNIGSDNAYWSSGWMGKVQGVIDGLRGIIRIIGDVAQVVSAVAGIVALVGLAFSWTGVGAFVAAIAADVAVIGGLAKLATDIIDLALGAIQAVILVIRIRASSNPGERARLAALLKKESSEFGQLLTSIGVQFVFMAAGAGLGAAISGEFNVKGFWKAFFGPLHPQNKFALTMIREAAAIARTIGPGLAKEATEKFGTGMSYDLIGHLVAEESANEARRQAIRSIERSLAATRLGAGAGGTLAGVQTGASTAGKSAAGGGAPTGAGTLDIPGRTDVSLANVSAWPEGRQQVQDLRGWVQNASGRMKDQYDLAHDDLDPADRGKVDEALGKVEVGGKKIRADSLAKQQEAADQQMQLDKATLQAQKAGTLNNDAKAKQAEANQKMETANRKAAAEPPKTDDSWFTGAMAWVGGKISAIQSAIQSGAGHVLAWAAGLDEAERQMAGLPSSLSDEKQQEAKAAAEAKEAETHSSKIDAQVAAIKTNKTTFEQGAIQATYDTMRWLNGLDDLGSSLDQTDTEWAAYIAEVAPAVRHELDVKKGKGSAGAQIDDAYILPITEPCAKLPARFDDTVKSMRGSVPGMGDDLETYLKAKGLPVEALPARHEFMEAAISELSFLEGSLGGAKSKLAGISGAAQKLKDTTDYAGAQKLAGDLQDVVQEAIHDTAFAMGNIVAAGVEAKNKRMKSAAPPPATPATAPTGAPATPPAPGVPAPVPVP